MARPSTSSRSALFTLCVAALPLLGGCEQPLPEGGESFARAIIGPDGGQVAGGSVTLDIPAGALSSDTDIELRRSDDIDLSLPGYRQAGAVVSIYPQDLILELPAALTFDSERERPVVIFEQDSLDVVAFGQTAYINEFSRSTAAVIESDDVVPHVSVSMPTLAATPADTGTPVLDTLHLELQISDPASFNLDVVLSPYDMAQAYDRSLKGTGEGECGFRLVNVTGGSLRADCSDSPFTATIRSAGTQVTFDIEPLQANDLDVPVAVGVVVGGSDIAFHGGFFGFETCTGDGC